MKIRFVLPPNSKSPDNIFGTGGSETSIFTYAKELAKRGNDVEVIYAGASEASSDLCGFRVRGLRKINAFAGLPPRRLQLAYLLPAFLESTVNAADILHVVGEAPMLLLPRYHLRVADIRIPVPPRWWRYVHCANRVLCCCKFVGRLVEEAFPELKAKVSVVYSPIDSIHYSRGDGMAVRRKLGISKESVVILCAGQIVRHKGQIHLVRAFRMLCRSHRSLHLLIVGSSNLWSNVSSRKAQEYGNLVSEESKGLPIILLGNRPLNEMPNLYAAADMLVCPSTVEYIPACPPIPDHLPRVNMEAMAAGKPVVATMMGGIPEVVVHGKTGYLVPSGDSSALAEAVERLVVDPELRLKMGQAGRQRVEENFTIEKSVTGLLNVYSNA